MISSIKPSPFWHKVRFQLKSGVHLFDGHFTILPHTEFEPNDHWENAPHFIHLFHDQHLNRIRVPWTFSNGRCWDLLRSETFWYDQSNEFLMTREPWYAETRWFPFLKPYKLNWKFFNVLSKMTKRIKLMQSIYYLVTWKIKMIPDIKIGDYWSGKFSVISHKDCVDQSVNSTGSTHQKSEWKLA